MNKENILMVSIPYYRENCTAQSEVQVDFLFGDEENTIVSINDKTEFEDFINNVDSMKLNVKENKLYQHADAIKNYLEKYFSNSYKGMNKRLFEPDNFMKLDSLLAYNDNIIIVRTNYLSIAFIPDKIKQRHIDSMNLLSDFFDDEETFYVERVIDLKNIEEDKDLKFKEILDRYFKQNTETRGRMV